MTDTPGGQVITQTFEISIAPMGAPRQTRADSWKKRPVVLRYRAYKDALRLACRGVTMEPIEVMVHAYIAMPDSWSNKKRLEMCGKACRSKPDWDNIGKGVCDALWEQDSVIADGGVRKRWSSEDRLTITVRSEPVFTYGAKLRAIA